jgi:HPt (histidine-containing phosphotransfer) domain-containing protein
MGGNRSLLQRSIGAFMQDAQGLYERVTSLINRAARADARRELHTFKGVAATLGATRLAELAARAEKAVDDGSGGAQMDALLQQVAREVAEVLPALQQVSDRLGGAAPPQDAAASLASGREPDNSLTQHGARMQLAELLLALQESDMVAMELHAALRQHADEALACLLEPLDAAMADMEFERAAVECEKVIAQLTVP